jgi:hypothetical protein
VKDIKAIKVEGGYDAERDFIISKKFILTTCDLQDQHFKKQLVSVVNGFLSDEIDWDFENYIDDNECDIEGINKKLGDIEGFHGLEERYYYDFSCKVVELSKDEIQKLQMIPENVTIYSLDGLEDIGVKNLDLPTIKLLRKLDIV